MGQVYRARDPRLGREVAIKVLPEEMSDPGRFRRFETEARATGGLNHPNILTIYDIGKHEGRPYLVAELLEGENLRERLHGSRLTIEVAIGYALEIARGLAAAHKRGIIHRDIKPENIFVTEQDTIKILDFGLAKRVQPPAEVDSNLETATAAFATQLGMVLGTVGYFSPEQARGGRVDERSDLFSFGAVLYEMLAGQRPFAGDSPADVISALMTQPPPELSGLGVDLPPHVAELLGRCLEKDPADRIGSAQELVRELEACQAGAEAAPSERPRPWRLAPLLGAGLVALIIAALAIWGVGWQAREAPEKAPATGLSIESVAVLPLENLSEDPDQDYFAAGMTEALIADLSRLGDLKVISRTSVIRYKETTKTVPEIADELGVDAVVEGSVARSGNRVRIRTRLVEATTDHQLWTNSFEREIENVLGLQSEVAREITREIGASLGAQVAPTKKRRRVDPEAYDAYLKAQIGYLEGTEDPDPVIQAFERAIELDPSFAPAHAAFADFLGYLAMTGSMGQGDAYLRSRQLARRAVELDPDLPLARTVLARINFQYEWDWSAAEAEFKRALELNPDDALTLDMYGAYRVIVHGDCDHGLAHLEAARDRDPFNPGSHFDLGIYSYLCRRWDESIEHMTRVTELAPEFAFSRLVLAWDYALKGWTDRAAQQCLAVIEELGDRFDPQALSSCAWVNGKAERADVAARLVSRLRDPPAGVHVDPVFLSWGCLAVEDSDCAIGHLEEALRQRSSTVIFMRVAPPWDSVRDDPRFQAILERLNFPS